MESLKIAAQRFQAVAGRRAEVNEDNIQETLARNLVTAMHDHGVKRLVNLSAFGAGNSAKTSGLMITLVRSTIYRHIFADKDRGEEILLGAGLDLINVRPRRLLDVPSRGSVRASLDRTEVGGEVAREDVAAFLIAQLESDVWLGQSPFIGYGTSRGR